MSEPRTEAGKALLAREAFNGRSFAIIRIEDILVIEEEAVALAHDRSSGSGLDAMKQGLRNDRNVFQRFIRDLEERSPESAKSHIIRTSRAVIEDIDNLFAALAGSSDPEAVGLDVERLARAMARCAEVGPPAHINPDDAEEHWPSYVAEAEEYAREYAALTEAKPESPEPKGTT